METLTTVKKDEDIQVVQNAINDFLNGKVPDVVNACTDDVQWGTYDNAVVPFGKTYSGKKGVGQFFNDLGSTADFQDFRINQYYSDKDMVFGVGHQKATVKTTGKAYDHDFLLQFKLRKGKISNFFAWLDSRDQSEAFTHSSPYVPAKTAIIQKLYQLFGEGNIPALVEQLTDSVVWDVTKNTFISNPRVYKGKQDVMEFFKDVASSVRIPVFQPLNFFENGDTVYVNGRFEMDLIRENKSVKLDWTMRWRFNGDKISHFTEYQAPAE